MDWIPLQETELPEMMKRHTTVEKDKILENAFSRLAAIGITSKWSTTSRPYRELENECRSLMTDPEFAKELRIYLQNRTIISRALETFFTYISMSARANWYDVPEEIRGITARGWFLGRWIPTFLIIDGPIGRFLCDKTSPLCSRLDDKYPLLTAAHDFLSNRLFKLLRNGFAHWAFDWEVVGNESYIVSYDWERDLPTAKLHLEQADAFHIIAFALIEILNSVFIMQHNANG